MELDKDSKMIINQELEKIQEIYKQVEDGWSLDITKELNIAVAIYLKRGNDIHLVDEE